MNPVGEEEYYINTQSVLRYEQLGLIEEQLDTPYDADDCLFVQLYIWLYYGHYYMAQQHTVYGYILLFIIFSALTNNTSPHINIYHIISYLLKIVLNRDIFVE